MQGYLENNENTENSKSIRRCKKCHKHAHFSEFTYRGMDGKEFFHHRCLECVDKTQRQCSVCCKIKTLKHFSKDRKSKRGYHYKCNKCRGFATLPENTYFERHRDEFKERQQRWYSNNQLHKIADRMRSRISVALKRKKWNKSSTLSQYLGCNLDELKAHLESQFKLGMTWHNYGKWHIDHKYPLSLASTTKELYELCKYTNLQPLWAVENLKKYNKPIF